MANMNTSHIVSFPANGALTAFTRVALNSSGRLVAAGLTDKGIGTTEIAAAAAGDLVPVRLWMSPGTRRILVTGAGDPSTAIYTAANGSFSTTQGTNAVQVVIARSSWVDGGEAEVLFKF